VTDSKEAIVTRAEWLMMMHDMMSFLSQLYPIHMVHTHSPPVSQPETDYTPDGLLEMNNYLDNYNTEFIRGDNDHQVYRVRIYKLEQMMFMQRRLGHMFGVGARKRFGKAHNRSLRGLPVLGATRVNLITHLKSEIDPKKVKINKG
jgi:hypothetical protein